MRRTRSAAKHTAPFLEDLLDQAVEPLEALGPLGLSWVNTRTASQSDALIELWAIFSSLPIEGRASCVGISKAVLLITNGEIGPALDSQVRGRLGIQPPVDAGEWLEVLEAVGADIRGLERDHGRLAHVVPQEYTGLADGRLYDMVFGPGEAS
jgi:hypothetical protein